MVEINKKFGFYGTVRTQFDVDRTDMIWFVVLKRLCGLYTNKPQEEIIELLNAKAGRHFADELLDMPEPVSIGVVMMRIAMLNKLKMAKWWAYHHGVLPAVSVLDKRMLLRTAIKSEMRKKEIRKLAASILGCDEDEVWKTPEMWLDAENTETQELELMWCHIQEKLTSKRIKHGHNRNIKK